MRISRLVPLIVLLASNPAQACGGPFGWNHVMTAMTVRGEGRIYFHRDEAERPGCPAAGEACRAAAYLVPGDVVIVTETAGAFACASFSDRRGRQTQGWLPSSALTAVPSEARIDWTGRWVSGPERRITITRADGDRLRASGEASWGGSDPARVQRGAVNVGDVDADFRPQGADAALTSDVCHLQLARRGPYLLVEDNMRCGGHNVTFTGMYRRG